MVVKVEVRENYVEKCFEKEKRTARNIKKIKEKYEFNKNSE